MRRDEEDHEVVVKAVDDNGREDAFGPVRHPAQVEAEDEPHWELVDA